MTYQKPELLSTKDLEWQSFPTFRMAKTQPEVVKKTPDKFAIRFFPLSFFFFLIVLQALGIPSYLGRHEEVHAHATAIKKLLPQIP